MPPSLEVEGLSVARRRIPVVHALSFNLRKGDCLALLGANGAGKTSAVEAVAGLLPKTSGTIRLHEAEITRLSAAEIARKGLSLVPQWRDLFPSFTVEETLQAALNAGAPRGRRRFEDIYELFPKLASRRGQTAGTLSGGEQQMLAIGRALATEPSVLVLDEPTARTCSRYRQRFDFHTAGDPQAWHDGSAGRAEHFRCGRCGGGLHSARYGAGGLAWRHVACRGVRKRCGARTSARTPSE